MAAISIVIFALEALCTYFVCMPGFQDPKPGPRTSRMLEYVAPASMIMDSNGQLRSRGPGERSIQSRSLSAAHLGDQLLYQDLSYVGIPENPVVDTLSGKVRGFRMTTIKGRDIAAFTSIPFAQPPVGHLRFRAPLPIQPWEGIRDANQKLPYCTQLDGGTSYRLRGQEDCLYLSIFTPKMLSRRDKSDNLLPVLLYIHGGAFVFGNGNYGPAYLLDKDIILVTINYRVGPLGFLSTGDEAAPGNAGLKDQALAMEWIHDNIEFFGGNKSQVTLMGQSAGAVSVHIHMMSKRTQGLFRSAIAHSASAFVFWAIRDVTPSLTTQLADRFKCPLNNSTMLVDCLRRQDSSFLVSEQFNLWHWWVLPGVLFGPVIEPESPDAIITAMPAELYRTGQVSHIPFMSGVVRDEGEVFGLVFSQVAGMRGVFNREFDQLAPKVFDMPGNVNTSKALEMSHRIRDFYLGDRKFNWNNKETVHNAFGDRYMVTGVHKGLQYHTAYGQPTYGYYFNYQGRLGLANSLGYRQEEWGVTHGDDLLYLFNNSNWFHPLVLDTPEYEVAEFLINVWSNFVQTGRPLFTDEKSVNVDFWAPIQDPRNMTFLEINQKPRFISEPFQNRISFWETLFRNTSDFVPDPLSYLLSNSSSNSNNSTSGAG